MYKQLLVTCIMVTPYLITADNKSLPAEDTKIALQFKPVVPQPFSDHKDDQYFAELLRNIIDVDQELQQNLRLKLMSKKPLESIIELIAQQNKSIHIIASQDKSFGWNDPLAIVSGLIYNHVAQTPNELIILIEESNEFPGKYKATIQGKGLYPQSSTAHGKMTNFIKKGPQHISKYANLDEIISFKDLYDSDRHKFKSHEKEKLNQSLPSLQGEVHCNCYFHGCDVTGTIFFDMSVLTYLLQEKNGNRYKNNTIQRAASSKTEKISHNSQDHAIKQESIKADQHLNITQDTKEVHDLDDEEEDDDEIVEETIDNHLEKNDQTDQEKK